MTPRTIFRILLRTMGVFVLKDLISAAVSLYYSLGYDDDGTLLGIATFGFLLYCSVIYILIFKTDMIIDILKLDKGFKVEEFSFYENKKTEQIDSTVLLNMAFLVSAIFVLTTQVPVFLRDLANYYHGFRLQIPNSAEMIAVTSGKILLAIIIITYHKQLVAYIERRSGKQMPDKED